MAVWKEPFECLRKMLRETLSTVGLPPHVPKVVPSRSSFLRAADVFCAYLTPLQLPVPIELVIPLHPAAMHIE